MEQVNDTEPSDSENETDEPNDQNVVWADSDDGLEFSEGISWQQATGSLIIVVIGAGVMALPQLPMKGGLLLSFITMYICGHAITESGVAFWKGVMANNLNSDKKIISYEDFGRQGCGDKGETAVTICMLIYYVGVVSGFMVLISDAVHHLTGVFTPQRWNLYMFPVFALVAMLPNVTAVAKAVPLAVASVLGLCLLIVGKSFMDGQYWQHWPDAEEPPVLHRMWPQGFLPFGTVVATMFGAFGVNGNVPTILCEMRDQTEFKFAFRTAMLAVGLIYALVMGCGYYGYGEFMQPDIIKSMASSPADKHEAFHVKYDEWTGPKAKVVEDIASALLFVKLMIALPLNMMVIFYSFQTLKYTKDYVPAGSAANKAMRIVVVAIAELIAQCIPNFGNLFAVVCSLAGPMLQVIFPLMFSSRIRAQFRGKPSSGLRRFMHGLIYVLAAFTLTVGLYSSVLSMMDQKDVVVDGASTPPGNATV